MFKNWLNEKSKHEEPTIYIVEHSDGSETIMKYEECSLFCVVDFYKV